MQEVTILRLQATDEDAGSYNQLFSYLNTRSRCGVVSSWGRHIKDMYVVPLAGNILIPSVLLPFDGPGKCDFFRIDNA